MEGSSRIVTFAGPSSARCSRPRSWRRRRLPAPGPVTPMAGTGPAASGASTWSPARRARCAPRPARATARSWPRGRRTAVASSCGSRAVRPTRPSAPAGGPASRTAPPNARYDAIDATAGSGAVVVGRRTTSGGTDSIIAVFTPSGKLSTSFHSSGRVTFNAGGDDARHRGRGRGRRQRVRRRQCRVGRVRRATTPPRGVPDTGWDGDGRRSGLAMSVSSIALRPDGAVGASGGATTLRRRTGGSCGSRSTGSIDSGFGGCCGSHGRRVAGTTASPRWCCRPTARLVADRLRHRCRRPRPDDRAPLPRRRRRRSRPSRRTTSAFGVKDAPVGIVAPERGATMVAAELEGRERQRRRAPAPRSRRHAGPGRSASTVPPSPTPVADRSSAPSSRRPDRAFALGVSPSWEPGRGRGSDSRPTARPGRLPSEGIVIDGFGGLYTDGARAASGAGNRARGKSYWPGWDIARGVAVLPGGQRSGGRRYGGVHGFTFGDSARAAAPKPRAGPYWPGWDIVRGVAVLPEGTGGYELDGVGRSSTPSHRQRRGHRRRSGRAVLAGCGHRPWRRAHAEWSWRLRRRPTGVDAQLRRCAGAHEPAGLWPGQDVARGIALAPDGDGGWILDYSGGLHPFGTGGDRGPSDDRGRAVLVGPRDRSRRRHAPLNRAVRRPRPRCSAGRSVGDGFRTRRNVLLITVDQWRGECLGGGRASGRPHAESRPTRGRGRVVPAALRAGRAVRAVARVAAHGPVPDEAPLTASTVRRSMRGSRTWRSKRAPPGTTRCCSGTPTRRPTRASSRPTTPASSPTRGCFPGTAAVVDLPEHRAPGACGCGRRATRSPTTSADVRARVRCSRRPGRVRRRAHRGGVPDRCGPRPRGGDGGAWFVHAAYIRPHPPFVAPEPYASMYDPADVPEPVRAETFEAEGAVHPVLAGAVSSRACASVTTPTSPPGARDLLRDDERGRCAARPSVRRSPRARRVGRHARRAHLGSRRAARRPLADGEARLVRAELPHPLHRPRSRRAAGARPRGDRSLHRERRRDAHRARVAGAPGADPVRRPFAAPARPGRRTGVVA